MLYLGCLSHAVLVLFFLNCLKSILSLDTESCSRRVLQFREWSIAPYRILRNGIDGREFKRIAAMSESSRKSFFRDLEWSLKNEPLHRTVQRRQREALKREVHQPLDTGSINTDIVSLVLKLSLMLLVFIILYRFFEIKLTGVYLYYNYVLFGVIYAIGHITAMRLALRESRFWWWRPWPVLSHIYVKGFFSERYERVLYALILPINPIGLLAPFFIVFSVEKLSQQYPLFYYKRTILYRLGALGMVILYYVLKFFFDNVWIIITPVCFLINTLVRVLELVRIALKFVGIDTRKIYARFRYKLSEYSFWM